MSLQYGEDDDDLFDSTDEDEEESENDLSSDAAPIRPRPTMQARNAGKRRLRIRPMSPSMVDKHPDVVTILLTRSNGQQLMFVRK